MSTQLDLKLKFFNIHDMTQFFATTCLGPRRGPKAVEAAGSAPPCIYARGANPDFGAFLAQNEHPRPQSPKKQLNCKIGPKPPYILKK